MIAANSHGPGAGAHTTAPTDPLITLGVERAKLEADSGLWAALLVVASIIVAVGVILEFAEDVFEIFTAVKERQRIGWRKQVVLICTILVIIGVTAEFWAESKSGGTETRLCANNAAAQGVLDKRVRNATQAAVDLANKFGGLRGFVQRQEGGIEDQMRSFRSFSEKESSEANLQLSQLSKDRSDLDRESRGAQDAASVAKDQLEQARQQFHAREISTAQLETLTEGAKGWGIANINVYSAPNDSESYRYASLIVSALVRAGIKTKVQPYPFGQNMNGTVGGSEIVVTQNTSEPYSHKNDAVVTRLAVSFGKAGISVRVQTECDPSCAGMDEIAIYVVPKSPLLLN